MLKLLILACIITVAIAVPLRVYPRKGGRIVGGQNTTIENAPYQVSLQTYGSHNCGGTIIAKQWILTAGHCSGYSASAYKIRAGSTYHNRDGTLHKVAEVIRHQGYGTNNNGLPLNDIALMRVDEAFQFDETRQPLPLFNLGEEAIPGAITVITGWGNTFQGYPSVLHTVNVPIVSKAQCNESYGSYGGIPDNQICAAFPEGGKDACQGDSGGPLAIDGRLAGVVSWGYGCAKAGYPGVYTEVAAYRSWIREQSGV